MGIVAFNSFPFRSHSRSDPPAFFGPNLVRYVIFRNYFQGQTPWVPSRGGFTEFMGLRGRGISNLQRLIWSRFSCQKGDLFQSSRWSGKGSRAWQRYMECEHADEHGRDGNSGAQIYVEWWPWHCWGNTLPEISKCSAPWSQSLIMSKMRPKWPWIDIYTNEWMWLLLFRRNS